MVAMQLDVLECQLLRGWRGSLYLLEVLLVVKVAVHFWQGIQLACCCPLL